MPRYKLTIAYDGTGFCGWQKQEPPADAPVDAGKVMEGAETRRDDRPTVALRTVQAVVERAVREVVRERVILMGASRTDAGVHARGQVAAFSCGGGESDAETERRSDAEQETGTDMAPTGRTGWPASRGTETLVRAINSRLPEDVLVVGAEIVHGEFNPIGDCVAKGYSYALHVSPRRALWERDYVQHVWANLDVGAMNAAAARIVGEHDFAAFAAAGHGRTSTVRTVFECRVVEEEEGIEASRHRGIGAGAIRERRLRIDVSGNGFLWNMVRIIAGTLVDVGRGKLTPEDVASAIESKDRRKAGPTMPARGLCLEWIRYGKETQP